jgi:hypothetical protein
MASYITEAPQAINPLGMLSTSFKPDLDIIDKKLYSLIVDERDFK